MHVRYNDSVIVKCLNGFLVGLISVHLIFLCFVICSGILVAYGYYLEIMAVGNWYCALVLLTVI